MKKYTYKNKKTGQIIQSDERLNEKDFFLVKEIRNGMIKSNNVIQK